MRAHVSQREKSNCWVSDEQEQARCLVIKDVSYLGVVEATVVIVYIQ